MGTMTKAELYDRIADLMCAENRNDPAACKANALKALGHVDEWVAEVIGKDDENQKEELFQTTKYTFVRNALKEEQRERAGLTAEPQQQPEELNGYCLSYLDHERGLIEKNICIHCHQKI